jgi:hypothetical protein
MPPSRPIVHVIADWWRELDDDEWAYVVTLDIQWPTAGDEVGGSDSGGSEEMDK